MNVNESSLADMMKKLKTVAQRDQLLRRIAHHRKMQYQAQEKQMLLEKAPILQNSKKRFLSLIRGKESETCFLKYRPMKKPLNILRMMHELQIGDRANKEDTSEVISPIETPNQVIKQSMQLLPVSLQKKKPLERQSLEYLTLGNVKPKDTPILTYKEQTPQLESKYKPRKRDLNLKGVEDVEVLLRPVSPDHLQDFQRTTHSHSFVHLHRQNKPTYQVTSFQKSYISVSDSQSRIQRSTSQGQFINIKESDNLNGVYTIQYFLDTSLVSHTELMLDNLYQEQLNPESKHYERQQQQQQFEAIKLFYRKVYRR